MNQYRNGVRVSAAERAVELQNKNSWPMDKVLELMKIEALEEQAVATISLTRATEQVAEQLSLMRQDK